MKSYPPFQCLNYLVDYFVLYLSAFYFGVYGSFIEKIHSNRVSIVADNSNTSVHKLVFDYNRFLPQMLEERKSLVHIALVVFNSSIFQSVYSQHILDAEKWKEQHTNHPNAPLEIEFPFEVRMEKKSNNMYETIFSRNQVEPTLRHKVIHKVVEALKRRVAFHFWLGGFFRDL